MVRNRSNVYGFLAAIYSQEMTADLLQQIKDPRFQRILSDLGIDFKNEFFHKLEEELLEDLAVEYARLFLGPGKHISPHEAIHHKQDDADWGQLWGKSTVEVKKFVESTGLSYTDEYKGLPDHISVELEFMQQLTRREEEACKEDDMDGVMYCLKIEKKFIEDHIYRWVPIFCEKVIKEAELPFYRELAALTRSFIKFEMEELKIKGNGAK